MITKSGKHHFIATLVSLDKNGIEINRKDGFRFTAIDPQKYAEQLAGRFTSSPWKQTRFENLIDLDAE